MLFKYRAIKNGKVESKTIEAISQDDVVSYLRQKDYFVVDVRRDRAGSLIGLEGIVNRVTFNDIVDFTRQLAIMLNAGFTIVEALEILRKQIVKESLHKIIVDIETQIKAGNSMSFVLRQYPQHFSNLYIALVKSGEASGKLSEILLRLSENLEKQREFRGKLRGALIYPVFILSTRTSFMKLLHSYIARTILSATLLITLILVALYAFILFVDPLS